MVYVGGYTALLNLAGEGPQTSTFWAWAMWRAYHLSGLLSTKNKLGAIADWYVLQRILPACGQRRACLGLSLIHI